MASILFLASCGGKSVITIDSKYADLPVYGIDLNQHEDQKIDNFANLKNLTFVICKISEGTAYNDENFTSNWQNLKNHQLIRGSYHFYRSNQNPIEQAKFFLRKIDEQEKGELPPIVKIENDSLARNVFNQKIKTKRLQHNLLLHLAYLEKETEQKPIIYTNLAFADQYLRNENFAKYPLWISENSKKDYPILPKTWQKTGFKFWQKSSRYTAKSEISDLDIFNGTREDFVKLIGGKVLAPEKP
jgi:lysozyme